MRCVDDCHLSRGGSRYPVVAGEVPTSVRRLAVRLSPRVRRPTCATPVQLAHCLSNCLSPRSHRHRLAPLRRPPPAALALAWGTLRPPGPVRRSGGDASRVRATPPGQGSLPRSPTAARGRGTGRATRLPRNNFSISSPPRTRESTRRPVDLDGSSNVNDRVPRPRDSAQRARHASVTLSLSRAALRASSRVCVEFRRL